MLCLQEPYAGKHGIIGIPLKHQIIQTTAYPKSVIVSLSNSVKLTELANATGPNVAAAVMATGKENILILSVYIEPQSDVEQFLDGLTDVIKEHGRHKVIQPKRRGSSGKDG